MTEFRAGAMGQYGHNNQVHSVTLLTILLFTLYNIHYMHDIIVISMILYDVIFILYKSILLYCILHFLCNYHMYIVLI